jgi:hypothetical protein
MITSLPPWPADVQRARDALLVTIQGDPTGCAGCLPHAIALGAACRASQLSGRAVYTLLQESTGYRPRSITLPEVVDVTPRDQLMLAAIDAFYDVRS